MRRFGILEDAVEIYPQVFNGYNALGYAHLSKGELAQAANAFSEDRACRRVAAQVPEQS